MRIQVLSDLHAEFDPHCAQAEVVDLGADLVILAGDIDQGGAGVRWAAETWPSTPVIYVMGNHEPYGASIEATLERARAAAAGKRVHVLEREAVTIAGTRILGATLWSNLALAGAGALDWTRHRLEQEHPDYRSIEGPDGGRLRPSDTAAIHADTVAWLERVLATPHDGPTLVVTHHAPSPRSLGQWDEFIGESPWTPMDASSATDLEWLIRAYQPTLWIHGHTHRSGEYAVGETFVLSNQAGYELELSGWDPHYMLNWADIA